MRFWTVFVVVGLVVATPIARCDDVAGFGRTLDEAKLDARQHVLKRIGDLLESQSPPLVHWQPAISDIDAFIEGQGHAGPSIHIESIGLQHQWILPVRMPSVGELARRDRQAWRQRAAAMFAVGASVLAAAAGWFARRSRGRS